MSRMDLSGAATVVAQSPAAFEHFNEFHSHSGDIRLGIPESSSAQFSVETFSGSLDSEFPITLQPGQRSTGRPRRFEFTLGKGGARVTAESFSGDIVLARRARRER